MSAFNDEQRDYMGSMAKIPVEQKCDCRWYMRGECFGACYGDPVKGGAIRHAKDCAYQRSHEGLQHKNTVRPVCSCGAQEAYVSALLTRISELEARVQAAEARAEADHEAWEGLAGLVAAFQKGIDRASEMMLRKSELDAEGALLDQVRGITYQGAANILRDEVAAALAEAQALAKAQAGAGGEGV